MDWIHLTLLKGPVMSSHERGNEPSGSIKGTGFIDQLGNC
jgi:hypothetical protein